MLMANLRFTCKKEGFFIKIKPMLAFFSVLYMLICKQMMTVNTAIAGLSEWGLPAAKMILISGPCSVESESQIEQTAAALAEHQVQILRGGIWKPRTRPGSFMGIGDGALPWLVNAAKNNHLKSAVEVANAKHVEAALKAGVDILWIGARSTVSPFVVQEIADALQGVDIPVMIKNPINPDLDLWIGAIERINHAGIHKIAAIHRGFSTYEKNIYRNVPNWNIPLELKRLIPNIPLFCDPSHICGSLDLIQHISQKALDLNFDGLMIESHIDPHHALSDKDQQLSPRALGAILEHLIIRSSTSTDQVFIDNLKKLRNDIDKIDYEMLELVAARNKIIEAIGVYKKENNITIFQPERWAEIVDSRKQYGEEIKLSDELIMDLIKAIHREAIAIQTNILNNGK
jgi:chorismate mutase